MPILNPMDDLQSDNESHDSDQIDSDIEAELYSTIHHEVPSTSENNQTAAESCISIISNEETVIQEIRPLSNTPSSNNLNLNKKESTNKEVFKKSDNSLKRKSNLIANILDDIQVINELPSKRPKTANHANRMKGSASTSGNFTVVVSDSDSDSSVILSEPDEKSIRKLQVNVEDYIFISSDSESSFPCQGESEAPSLNHSGNDSFNGDYKDVWEINKTDLYRTKRKYGGRYHEDAVSTCNNCNRKGHVAKYCTEPKVQKCFICGNVHMNSPCRRRICVKCLKYGHDSRRCSFPIDSICCSICYLRGHGKQCCPDLWRRYHLTTSGEDIVRPKPLFQTTPYYCFNCGAEGHFGVNCTETRMDRSYPTWSSVISYAHPVISLDDFRRNEERVTPELKIRRKISRKMSQAKRTKKQKKNFKIKQENQGNRKVKKEPKSPKNKLTRQQLRATASQKTKDKRLTKKMRQMQRNL